VPDFCAEQLQASHCLVYKKWLAITWGIEMRKWIIAAVAVMALNGCGAFVPVVKLDELPPEKKQAMRSVKILSSTQPLDEKSEVVGIVEGNSCQNKTWDPPASRTAAIDQIKYFANEMGADAITNIQCSGREGTSTRTNCWELISCTAEAVKMGSK